MRKTVIALLIGFLTLIASSGLAQGGVPYKLEPQDVIRIQVYDEPQVNAVLPVGQDGNVSAPFVGLVRAQGKTTAELEAQLASLYQARLRIKDPKVSVTIEQYRPLRATVGGMVSTPGVYEFKPGDTLYTLLQRGGGANTDRADLRRATLKHAHSREVIPVDLYSMLVLGDTTQNYELQDGDELIVPEDTRNKLMILGALQSPGTYPFKEPMRLGDAISMAKGPIPIRSKMSQVYVIREIPGQPGKFLRIHADWVKFIRNGDAAQNIPLQAGDMIYVFETNTPDLNILTNLASTAFYIATVIRR